MQILDLEEREHTHKVGNRCEYVEPNVTESTILRHNGEVIGFYLKDINEMSPKLNKLMKIANAEFLSERVPKQLLERADVMRKVKELGISRKEAKAIGCVQYSTIIGSICKKPLMRRDYHNRSSVHAVKSAQTFIKAMLMATNEIKDVIGRVDEKLLETHLEAVKDIDDEWRLGELFTSSISNFNIAAPFHRDRANVKGTLNAIYTHRHNADGGCLYVPAYDACFEQPTGSLLLYPAWRDDHAVTPIVPTHDGGYRNSLVFYALAGFLK
jgi:hypothetical protein